ncbi:hypothetical protein D3C87_145060 [compost metagenome]
MKTWFFAMTMMSSVAAGAATSQVTALGNNPKWEALLGEMIFKGDRTETQNGYYMTLTHQVALPAPAEGHHVEYISTVGYYDHTGIYQPMRVEAVSETWRIDRNGNWDIDQWLFVISIAGDVVRGQHVHLVETRTGSIVEYDYLRTTEEEQLQQWKGISDNWYLWTGISP